MKKMKSVPSMPATGKFILTGHKKHNSAFTSIRCECSGDKILGYCTALQSYAYTYARESLLANYDNVKFYVEDEELTEFEANQLWQNLSTAINNAKIAVEHLGLAMDLTALQTAQENIETYLAAFDGQTPFDELIESEQHPSESPQE